MPKNEVPEHMPRAVLSKEELALHVRKSRYERYVQTAHFVQSKWFIIIAGSAVAIFLIITFLVSR